MLRRKIKKLYAWRNRARLITGSQDWKLFEYGQPFNISINLVFLDTDTNTWLEKIFAGQMCQFLLLHKTDVLCINSGGKQEMRFKKKMVVISKKC